MKTSLYEKYMAELKNCYQKIVASTDQKVKTELMKLVAVLEQSVKASKKEVEELHAQLAAEMEMVKKPETDTVSGSSDADGQDVKAADGVKTEDGPDSGPPTASSDPVEEEVVGAVEPKKELDEEAVHRLLQESDDEESSANDSANRVRVLDDIDEDELLGQ